MAKLLQKRGLKFSDDVFDLVLAQALQRRPTYIIDFQLNLIVLKFAAINQFFPRTLVVHPFPLNRKPFIFVHLICFVVIITSVLNVQKIKGDLTLRQTSNAKRQLSCCL